MLWLQLSRAINRSPSIKQENNLDLICHLGCGFLVTTRMTNIWRRGNPVLGAGISKEPGKHRNVPFFKATGLLVLGVSSWSKLTATCFAGITNSGYWGTFTKNPSTSDDTTWFRRRNRKHPRKHHGEVLVLRDLQKKNMWVWKIACLVNTISHNYHKFYGNSYWRNTHFPLNHACGRMSNDGSQKGIITWEHCLLRKHHHSPSPNCWPNLDAEKNTRHHGKPPVESVEKALMEGKYIIHG